MVTQRGYSPIDNATSYYVQMLSEAGMASSMLTRQAADPVSMLPGFSSPAYGGGNQSITALNGFTPQLEANVIRNAYDVNPSQSALNYFHQSNAQPMLVAQFSALYPIAGLSDPNVQAEYMAAVQAFSNAYTYSSKAQYDLANYTQTASITQLEQDLTQVAGSFLQLSQHYFNSAKTMSSYDYNYQNTGGSPNFYTF